MQELFNYNSKFIQTLNKFADMMIVSTMWLILTLTIIGFGPATTAAYHVMSKVVRYERGSVIKEFFKALKDNFWKSLVMGMLLMVFLVSLYFYDFAQNSEYIATRENPQWFPLIMLVLKSFLAFGLAVYVFPIISRFNMPLARIFMSSLLLMFRHLGSTLLMLLMLAAAITVVAIYPMLIILVPGLLLFGMTYPMERIMRRHMSAEDREEDDTKDQWYLDT